MGNYNILFQTIREIVGRGLSIAETATGREVVTADDARAGGSIGGATPAAATGMTTAGHRSIGAAGIALIKRFEGCERLRDDGMVEAYPDPGTGGRPWTIGWGATGNGIGPGTLWTREQCDTRLEHDLSRYAADVDRALGAAATRQCEFDALVSFHYNTGAIGRATLTRRHRAGDLAAAAAEFGRWNRAGGRVLRGLIRRRAEEARLYSST